MLYSCQITCLNLFIFYNITMQKAKIYFLLFQFHEFMLQHKILNGKSSAIVRVYCIGIRGTLRYLLVYWLCVGEFISFCTSAQYGFDRLERNCSLNKLFQFRSSLPLCSSVVLFLGYSLRFGFLLQSYDNNGRRGAPRADPASPSHRHVLIYLVHPICLLSLPSFFIHHKFLLLYFISHYVKTVYRLLFSTNLCSC